MYRTITSPAGNVGGKSVVCGIRFSLAASFLAAWKCKIIIFTMLNSVSGTRGTF
jgi:hypothetical protein